MYELINKELRMESCNIGDLTMNTMSSILKQWNDGSSISSLILFYQPKEDVVIMNRDNKEYSKYCNFTETYLKGDEIERKEMKSRYSTDEKSGMKEVITILDHVIDRRKNHKELFILRRQPVLGNGLSTSILEEIISGTQSHYLAMCEAFQYGVIQGKRIERSKKRQSTIA